MGVSIQINHAALERAKKRLQGAAKRFPEHRGTVGIHEDLGEQPKLGYDGKPTDATLAEVATYHEFNGRSWLRTWVDSNEPRLRAGMQKAMKEQYEGDKFAVDKLMAEYAIELRDWIEKQEGGLSALSPATVAEKQKHGLPHPDVPLFATGQLADAIKGRLDGYRL